MSEITRKFRVLDDESDVPMLNVAFATSDRKTVDQHFGSASCFSIYGVNVDRSKLLSVSEFGDLDQDGNEDKLQVKLGLIEDCIAVYCRACGASAVRQLLAQGVQPVKVAEGAEINDLIAQLQQELREGPSTWLAKAMRRNGTLDTSRFDDMEAEGGSD